MTILQRGITGFDTTASVDSRMFKKAVYSAAQKTAATVLRTSLENAATPNFYQVDFQFDERFLAVLCNQSFPIVAIVHAPVENDGVRPLDLDEFAEEMRSCDFYVATAAELARPIESTDLSILGEAEKQQVRYWKPQCIGQLVFNWWD